MAYGITRYYRPPDKVTFPPIQLVLNLVTLEEVDLEMGGDVCCRLPDIYLATEVALRRARLVLGWATVVGWVCHIGM